MIEEALNILKLFFTDGVPKWCLIVLFIGLSAITIHDRYMKHQSHNAELELKRAETRGKQLDNLEKEKELFSQSIISKEHLSKIRGEEDQLLLK